MQLRPHQERAIGDVREAFRRRRRVLLVAPTGFGKTAVSAQLIAWAVARGRRVLFLVHRREIVLDTHRRLPGSGLVMAGERVTEAPVQVASIQTVVAREQHPPADLVVWDECFPAGTTVDGTPIENLRAGDVVRAYDVSTRRAEPRRVTHTFKSHPSSLVRVHLHGGQSIVATPGHPFYVGGGNYENASNLSGHAVYRLRGVGQSRDAAEDVRRRVPCAASLVDDGADQQVTRVGANEGEEPDARREHAGADGRNAQGHRTSPGRAGRQRDASSSRAVGDAAGAQAAQPRGGVRSEDRDVEGARGPSQPLQDRHRAALDEGCGRDRRGESRLEPSEGAGREEDGVLERFRVDRVEVLEPGCDGTFGGLCPDGHVYNIEVDGLNNYFADGVLVHNCHHAVADTYRAVAAQYPKAWHLGLTATPQRADGAGLRDAFDEIVVGATVAELVEGGYLAPVDVVAPPKRLAGIAADAVGAWVQHAAGRPTVAFHATVAESRAFVAGVAARGIEARHIDGGTRTRERDDALRLFAAGRVQVLSNAFVLTEGWDCPRAEVCLLARGCGSDATFLQMVGRVRRVSDPGKRALIVDLAGVVHEHGHPDEPREYTLDGIRRPRSDRPWITQCQACGCVVEGAKRGLRCPMCGAAWPTPKPVRVQRADVGAAVIVPRAVKDARLAELLRTARERGYRPGWVGVRFKEEFGHWPAGIPSAFGQRRAS